jgi:hypothetical protein
VIEDGDASPYWVKVKNPKAPAVTGEAEGNLHERRSNEKKKDSGRLSAVAGVLVVLPTTAKA